ncbi:hypothetical protein RRG39_01345 [Mycoplasmopsis cynos]|uniref:OppA family ABC transporter substrate-binding lipoprotein n=1 Tax=Mycoplasmopsis cynos TaxID=171284 RepID=UPI002AFF6924|nr:hypothetical protein [Mycoplasmopsis cynos]WQQ16443.1 hypothetical protein RRG51_01585 [Mycoplasmopsis cynos]WQQ17172.1 hypothetical protein RRG39_01345 [Mycoplasmopsis cynos]
MRRKFLLLSSSLISMSLPILVSSCSGGIEQRQESEKRKGKVDPKSLLKEIMDQPKKAFSSPRSVSNNFSVFARKGVYKRELNSIYNETIRNYDWSSSYGGWSSLFGNEVATLSTFFRLESFGQPRFTEKISFDRPKINKTSKIFFTRPSVTKWSFDYAKSIILVVDGKEIVYDNDQAEILEKPDQEEKYYSKAVVELTSANEKSINNPSFFKNLDKASSFKIQLRDDAYWVNSKGEKTKYKVQAKDFYYGFIRSILFNDTKLRRSNGGSQNADILARAIIPENDDQFKEEQTYTNKYIFSLYNISFDKIFDEKEFIRTENKKSYVVFHKEDENLSAQFSEFFKDNLYGKFSFIPAPSAYIDEVNDNLNDHLSNFATIDTPEAKNKEHQLKNELSNVNGKTRQAGVYWYGLNLDHTLYAGRYYYAGYNANDFTRKWKLNKEYWDKDYVNNKRRIKEFNVVYKSQKKDEELFKKEEYNNFISGRTATVGFSSLDKANRDYILQNRDDFGLSKVQSRNTKTTIGSSFGVPVPDYTKKAGIKPLVNDAFSQLVWGAKLDEIVKGTAKGVLKHSTTGAAAEFKNILTAAINWTYVVTQAYAPNDVMPWLSGIAPDISLKNDTNDNSLAKNTPRENSELINQLFVVDAKTNQRINLGDNIGTEISPSENNVTGKEAKLKYASSAFDTLKKHFKKLVDEFYSQHPDLEKDPKNNKIMLRLPQRYLNTTDELKKAYEGQLDILNSLYPGKFQVELIRITNADDFYNSWIFSSSPISISGWSADYELIGSSIDAKSWQNQLMPILVAMVYDQEYKSKLKDAYPILAKTSEQLKYYLEHDGKKLKFSIPLEKWSSLNNKVLHSFSDYLGLYSLNEKDELVELDRSKVSEYVTATDFSAKFFLFLNTDKEQSLNKKELLELASEAANITGNILNTNLSILKEPVTDSLVNPNYITPSTYLDFEDASNYLLINDAEDSK